MIRKRGRFWIVDIHVPYQGRIKRKFIGEDEARIFVERKMAAAAERRNPTKDRQKSIGTLFPLYADELWRGTVEELNVMRMAIDMAERLGEDRPIDSITTRDVENLRKQFFALGNAKRTVNTKLTRLSKLLKHAHKLEMIEKAPRIDLEKVSGGRMRFRMEGEAELLLAHLKEVWHPFFYFLLYTGCRPSEATKVRWEDVDERRVIFWETKTRKNRAVPLVSLAAKAIPWHLRESQPEGPFANIIYVSFYHAFLRARDRAGLDKAVVPYTLRHTFASRMAKLTGGDFVLLKEWMGHTSLTTTMNYTHLENDALTGPAALLEEQIRNRQRKNQLLHL